MANRPSVGTHCRRQVGPQALPRLRQAEGHWSPDSRDYPPLAGAAATNSRSTVERPTAHSAPVLSRRSNAGRPPAVAQRRSSAFFLLCALSSSSFRRSGSGTSVSADTGSNPVWAFRWSLTSGFARAGLERRAVDAVVRELDVVVLPVTFGRWFGLRTEAAARKDRKLGTASSTRLLLHTPCHLDSEGTGQVFGGVRRGPPRAPFPGRVFAGRRLSVQVGARPWECGLPQTRSRPRASHGEAGLLGRRGRFGRAPGVCFVSGRRLPLRLRTSEPRRVLRESRAEPGIRRHEAGTAPARHDRPVNLPPVPASLERAAAWSWRLLVCAAAALAVLALLWYLRVIVAADHGRADDRAGARLRSPARLRQLASSAPRPRSPS